MSKIYKLTFDNGYSAFIKADTKASAYSKLGNRPLSIIERGPSGIITAEEWFFDTIKEIDSIPVGCKITEPSNVFIWCYK